jgi:hypothetical protein
MHAFALAVALFGCGGSPADDPNPNPPDPTTTTETTPPTSTPTEPPLPASCDAGTETWVQRVFPLVLGRRPHGAHEVRAWAWVADTYGREVAVRALTRDRSYDSWWKTFFTDALSVARTGDKEFASCFEQPLREVHDGSLAQFIRSNPPEGPGGFGEPFNMADVLYDALAADDLAVPYQAHLFARMQKPTTGANVSEEELEYNRRVNFGALFLDTYTNRDLVCIACHNSEFSLTPDRTFGAPGLYEQALFGASFGPATVEETYAIFKYHDLVAGFGETGKRPWGMDGACGEFALELPAEDFLGQNDVYWLTPRDATASVWEVERGLAFGASAISGAGPTVGADGSLEGEEALAWLLAQNIVDQVWQYGLGGRLTIAYGFSRNEAQRDRLVGLTRSFVQQGWSLRGLLTDIALDPAFNAGLSCGADPYGLDPIVDPYTVYDPNPAAVGNGPGDLVHRHTARALIRSLHDQLGWPPAPEWFGAFGGSDDLDFQGAIGVFLRESEPGFNGTDFQGLLAWEDQYVTCRNPDAPADQLVALYNAGLAADARVEDVVVAVKDRLLAQGDLTADERPLIEALLATPLTAPVADQDPAAFGRSLGLLCGALVMSPDWFLALEPRPIGPTPTLAQGVEADCANAVTQLAEEGVEAHCDGGQLVAGPSPDATDTGTTGTTGATGN